MTIDVNLIERAGQHISANRDYNFYFEDKLELLVRRGWRIEYGKNHVVIKPPAGAPVSMILDMPHTGCIPHPGTSLQDAHFSAWDPHDPWRQEHAMSDVGTQHLLNSYLEELIREKVNSGVAIIVSRYDRQVDNLRKPEVCLTERHSEFKGKFFPLMAGKGSEEKQKVTEEFRLSYERAYESLREEYNDAVILGYHSYSPNWHNMPRKNILGVIGAYQSPWMRYVYEYFNSIATRVPVREMEPYSPWSEEFVDTAAKRVYDPNYVVVEANQKDLIFNYRDYVQALFGLTKKLNERYQNGTFHELRSELVPYP